jgi:tetratricopeptide (TPR) repeat protein
MKKKVTLAIGILVIILGLSGFFLYKHLQDPYDLNALAVQNPKLQSYIDSIKAKEKKITENTKRVESYLALGQAWKSLGDQTGNPKYYRAALDVYQEAIRQTGATDSTIISNAGNMAVYTKEYALAETYYKQAIDLAPGMEDFYIKLAELYEFNLGKSQADILAVYAAGAKRVVNPVLLNDAKQEYLVRHPTSTIK